MKKIIFEKLLIYSFSGDSKKKKRSEKKAQEAEGQTFNETFASSKILIKEGLKQLSR